jgi:hypothetical protein
MYGNAYVVGDDYNDTVCIGTSHGNCVDGFRFLSVTDVDPNIIPLDGMIGLAPDDPSNGPSYIASLKDAGMIDKKQFGLMIGTKDI